MSDEKKPDDLARRVEPSRQPAHPDPRQRWAPRFVLPPAVRRQHRYVSLPGMPIMLSKFCSLCGREYVGPMLAHLETCQ